MRAKVAALAARDPAIEPAQRERAAESARRHLALAAEALAPRARPALVLVGGVVGTGKSTVAAGLADQLDGVVIASDRVRKRLAGVAPTARIGGAWQSGAYTAEQTERTYAGAARARAARARVGARRDPRRHVSGAARGATRRCSSPRKLGVAVAFVEVRCAPDVARERLARRAAAGTDPSDAGPELYAASAREFESPTEWPEQSRAVIDTDPG